MRELDSAGFFWLPSHDDDRLAGRLTYSPNGVLSLTLIGSFENSLPVGDTRIFGVIESGEVTLLDCFSTREWHGSHGISESVFRANSMLLGLLSSPEPEFLSVTVRFSDLDSWIGRTPFDDHDLRDLGAWEREAVVKVRPLDDVTSSFSRGDVTVRGVWNYRDRSISGITLYQQHCIIIAYESLTPLAEIIKDVGRLESFITLCVDFSIDLDEFIVRRPDVKVQMLSGEDVSAQRKIEYRAPRLKYRPQSERKERNSFEFLLSFDEAGGATALARWLDASVRFQRALDSCMSTRYAERMYAENRFLNITYAAEAFHRITQGGTYMDQEEYDRLMAAYLEMTPDDRKPWFLGRMGYGNDAPLPKRLRSLAVISKEVTRPLIGREGRWAQTIAQVRNELTHLGEGPSKIGGSDLYYLSESVFAVLRVCMLVESGISTSVLAVKGSTYPVAWHSEKIKESVQSVREKLGLASDRK